jgi:hypothetical protein
MNEPCQCESGKKYKKCCFLKDNEKRVKENTYAISEELEESIEILKENFPKLSFKNVSDKLTTNTYKNLQIQHMKDNICLIAERINTNEKVFKERDIENEEYDLLLMYHGAYRILNKGANVKMYLLSLGSFFSDPTKMELKANI